MPNQHPRPARRTAARTPAPLATTVMIAAQEPKMPPFHGD
jgi:hypothetical protein